MLSATTSTSNMAGINQIVALFQASFHADVEHRKAAEAQLKQVRYLRSIISNYPVIAL
jgi:hypothetical protein